jgi:hypothetical protein
VPLKNRALACQPESRQANLRRLPVAHTQRGFSKIQECQLLISLPIPTVSSAPPALQLCTRHFPRLVHNSAQPKTLYHGRASLINQTKCAHLVKIGFLLQKWPATSFLHKSEWNRGPASLFACIRGQILSWGRFDLMWSCDPQPSLPRLRGGSHRGPTRRGSVQNWRLAERDFQQRQLPAYRHRRERRHPKIRCRRRGENVTPIAAPSGGLVCYACAKSLEP